MANTRARADDSSHALTVLFSPVADQAPSQSKVVRVVRVDVPPVVRAYDPAAGQQQPPLLLGCAYALEGGEDDDEDGGGSARPPNGTATAARSPEVAMDAAMEEAQHTRGVVVKWYFRRTPAPVTMRDTEQAYQWIAGGGPEASGGLGPLSGRAIDVTAETPRADKTALHRVVRVDRPTAELTGEYRCQVEDWTAERRSAWYPMVVYSEYLGLFFFFYRFLQGKPLTWRGGRRRRSDPPTSRASGQS